MAPLVAPTLEQMLESHHVAYRDAAELTCRSLARGSLVAIQTSRSRFLITLRCFRARPVPAPVGALFQCLERRHPPRDERDLQGWIVVQDGFSGGRLVLVHEVSHFANRFVVWQRRREPVEVWPGIGWDPAQVAEVRARLLDEIAARHVAFLAETGLDPDSADPRWPRPGALFACAVKIASYPEVYADPGYVPAVIAQDGPDALRDLVGTWLDGLRGFHFYQRGTRRALTHARWLDEEIALARRGSEAPEVEAEGTL